MPSLTNAAAEPFRVAIVGQSSTSRYVRECFSIRSDFRCVDPPVTGPNPAHAGFSASAALLTDAALIYAAAGTSFSDLQAFLRGGQSLIVESPWERPAQDWQRLTRDAASQQKFVSGYLPRRWDVDFLRIKRVLADGRLGSLRQARYIVFETGLLGERASTKGILELVAPLLDQFRHLAAQNLSGPSHEAASLTQEFASLNEKQTAFCGRWSGRSDGGDLTLMIDVQTDSLAGFRSGWIVEGSHGACRDGRLFTRAADGEIVEEPLPNVSAPHESFFHHLAAALRGQPNELPTSQDMIALSSLLTNLG